MLTRTTLIAASLTLAAAGLASVAQAQDVGQHPAVFAPRQLPGVNPSTFIVGHPASPTTAGGHANHEHPAVTAKLTSEEKAIDANTFVVQPPAHVEWVARRIDTPVAVVIAAK